MSNAMTTPSRYPFLDDYMKYLSKDFGAARNTMRIYSGGIKAFFDWLLTNHRFNDIKRINATHIKTYRDYLKASRYRTASIVSLLRAVKSFLRYCVDMGHIEDTPFPTHMNVKGKKAMPHLVPTPHEIFRIRLQPKVRLAGAALFELLLSTGMREDELMQTYARDLNFNDRPYDMELKKPSPYFVGSINIQQTTHSTKNSMPRKVYFSCMASILIKRHLIQEGIAEKRCPIFPWSDSTLQDLIRDLGKGIINRNSDDLVGSDDQIQRERGFTDVDLDELDVSDAFKKAIQRRQEDERSIESYKRDASQPIRKKKRSLHPHALRHAYTNFCYYRTPLGTRQDDHNMRILLGHQGANSIFSYLKTLPLIRDDLSWNRLWLGKPDDWNGINR